MSGGLVRGEICTLVPRGAAGPSFRPECNLTLVGLGDVCLWERLRPTSSESVRSRCDIDQVWGRHWPSPGAFETFLVEIGRGWGDFGPCWTHPCRPRPVWARGSCGRPVDKHTLGWPIFVLTVPERGLRKFSESAPMFARPRTSFVGTASICSNPRISGQLRRRRLNLLESGPSSVEFGPNALELGRARPNLKRLRQKFVKIDWGPTKFGQLRPNLTKLRTGQWRCSPFGPVFPPCRGLRHEGARRCHLRSRRARGNGDPYRAQWRAAAFVTAHAPARPA